MNNAYGVFKILNKIFSLFFTQINFKSAYQRTRKLNGVASSLDDFYFIILKRISVNLWTKSRVPFFASKNYIIYRTITVIIRPFWDMIHI